MTSWLKLFGSRALRAGIAITLASVTCGLLTTGAAGAVKSTTFRLSTHLQSEAKKLDSAPGNLGWRFIGVEATIELTEAAKKVNLTVDAVPSRSQLLTTHGTKPTEPGVTSKVDASNQKQEKPLGYLRLKFTLTSTKAHTKFIQPFILFEPTNLPNAAHRLFLRPKATVPFF